MSEDFTFDVLDPDHGSDTAHEPSGSTRGDFLRRLVMGGGVLAAGGATLAEFAPAASAASTDTDITILNAALILEALGVAFYAGALKDGHLSGETRTFAEVVYKHEVQHAEFVATTLGRHAKKLPSFDFGTRIKSQEAVQQTAYSIEALCTAALVGVAPLLTRRTLKSAGVLLPVEAQHVAWISNIIHRSPAPLAFNPRDTIGGVKKTIAPLLVAS